MKLSDFDYKLPEGLIAQKPASPRDSSKMMVVRKTADDFVHSRFLRLADFLKSGDVLVFNDTKVIPARIFGQKKTGGKVEVLLLQPISEKKDFDWESKWRVLTKPGLKIGQEIFFSQNFSLKVLEEDSYERVVEFNQSGKKLENFVYKFGQMPLPPYIQNNSSKLQKAKNYQAIFAKNQGSAAAPTASFHFTKRLMKKLEKKTAKKFITLHVGLGTFQPVEEENILDHKMHAEWAEISQETAKYINKAKAEGKRIIAVGTTVARTLESFADEGGHLGSGKKFTNIFIYPGYDFKIIDGLVTNFHLPKSTLLMLVSALAGREQTKKAYSEAIKNKYRFYSFGDGMLIIP